jgi:hypothetical protein
VQKFIAFEIKKIICFIAIDGNGAYHIFAKQGKLPKTSVQLRQCACKKQFAFGLFVDVGQQRKKHTYP